MKELIVLSFLMTLFLLINPTFAQQGLVSYWKFDECSGNIVYDSIGNNHGTRYNFTDGWVSGKYNCALEFDGIDDYVDVGNDSSLNFGAGDFSIEFWIKISSSQVLLTNPTILAKVDSVNWINSYEFYLETIFEERSQVRRLRWYIWDDEGVNYIQVVANVSTDEWHHIVGVRKDFNLAIYVDGQNVTGIPEISGDPSLIDLSNNYPLYIGIYGDLSYPFNGTIDNVRIWNKALTDDEIENLYLYNSLTPPAPKPLIVYLISFVVATGIVLFVIREFFAKLTIEKIIAIIITVMLAIGLLVVLANL
jgi:hypothetical protein